MTALPHYPLHQRALSNQMQVVVHPDPTVAGVAVNLWFRVGSRDEQPGRTGFAHLFEHLMFQGTWTGVASGEHLAAIQAAGGTANATTSFDRTNYFETVHPGALDLALWLEAQRLEHLQVDEHNFTTQREVVKEEKRQRYDNVPYGDTLDELFALCFPSGHPYAHTPIGSMADLDAARLDEVQQFHQQHYQPANAVLVLAGNIEADQGFALAERYFGAIASSEPGRYERPSAPPAFSGVPSRTIRAEVPRTQLHLAWRLPAFDSADALALGKAMDILSGGSSAVLHRDLVMERDLAESASAGSMGLAGPDLGLLSLRVRPDQSLERARQAALDHLERLAQQGPSTDQLERADAQFERDHFSAMAQLESRADQINQWATLAGDPERVNTLVAEYQQVDAGTIAEAVGRWLAPEYRAELCHEARQQ